MPVTQQQQQQRVNNSCHTMPCHEMNWYAAVCTSCCLPCLPRDSVRPQPVPTLTPRSRCVFATRSTSGSAPGFGPAPGSPMTARVALDARTPAAIRCAAMTSSQSIGSAYIFDQQSTWMFGVHKKDIGSLTCKHPAFMGAFSRACVRAL
jgi:hypothetical protein